MFRSLHGRGRLHGHIYKSVCVHKNVYAYISSKRVQQYVYIYTCVVLSALFLCADDVILLEKKKIIQIVSWMDAEKKIFLSHSQSERKRFHNQHTRIRIFLRFSFPSIFFFFFSAKKGTKHSSTSFFFFVFYSFFFSSKLFCACVAAPKEREREKSAAGESARKYTHTHTHTHTRLYNNNNNKRPSCKKERENIVCVYCERVVDIQEEE